METDIKEMKKSLNFVYEKINDLKEDSKRPKKNDLITDKRIETLEELNATLQSRVIDLQARSMRDNLIFYNISEKKDENAKEIIHDLLENKLDLENANENVKIDRAHRLGRNMRSANILGLGIFPGFSNMQ